MVKDERILGYELSVLLSQRQYFQEIVAPETLPDVERLLRSRPIAFILRRIQELIWTGRAFTRQLFSKRRKGPHSPSIDQPRDKKIFLDVSAFAMGLTKGGIRRLSQQLAECALQTDFVVPTFAHESGLLSYADTHRVISMRHGDVFVIVSHFWEPLEAYLRIIRFCRNNCISVMVFVHDVIPAQYPAFMSGDFHRNFKLALFALAPVVDSIITLSAASADCIREVLRTDMTLHAMPPIRWFHMGADAIAPASRGSECSDRLSVVLKSKTFLTVGTILPHKGVPLAIAAFETLWSSGVDVNYLIIGRRDANWSHIPEQIVKHPLFGEKLFLIEDCNDGELACAYESAYCYIQPSIDEGFGIPLVEAASFNLPIIASDIPVFREIGSSNVIFFRVCDPDDLSIKIQDALVSRPASPNMKATSWQAAFQDLCQLVSSTLPPDETHRNVSSTSEADGNQP